MSSRTKNDEDWNDRALRSFYLREDGSEEMAFADEMLRRPMAVQNVPIQAEPLEQDPL